MWICEEKEWGGEGYESQALCALRHRLQARTRCWPFASKAADVKAAAEDEADVKVEDEEGKTEEGATGEGKGKKQLDGSITSSGGMSIPSCCCAWWRVPSGRRCSIPLRFVFNLFSPPRFDLIFLRSPGHSETSDQLKTEHASSFFFCFVVSGRVSSPSFQTTWSCCESIGLDQKSSQRGTHK